MIVIERLQPDHFGVVAGWLSDSSINRWLTSEWRGRSIDSATIAIACRNRRNALYLIRCDGRPCGLVGLADMDAQDRCAMVWYALGERELSGRGIASEAVNQLCRVGFGELQLACIYAWILRPNEASRRVLVKNGFREVGALRHASRFDDGSVDRIYFDLLPNELRTGSTQAT